MAIELPRVYHQQLIITSLSSFFNGISGGIYSRAAKVEATIANRDVSLARKAHGGSIATRLDHDESASMNARSASSQKVAKQRLHVAYRFSIPWLSPAV